MLRVRRWYDLRPNQKHVYSLSTGKSGSAGNRCVCRVSCWEDFQRNGHSECHGVCFMRGGTILRVYCVHNLSRGDARNSRWTKFGGILLGMSGGSLWICPRRVRALPNGEIQREYGCPKHACVQRVPGRNVSGHSRRKLAARLRGLPRGHAVRCGGRRVCSLPSWFLFVNRERRLLRMRRWENILAGGKRVV